MCTGGLRFTLVEPLMPDIVQPSSTQPMDTEAIARSKIGRHVTYFALGATTVLGFTAILVALFTTGTDLEKRFNYVKDVLTILLPLIGTWVGTVLAFYFSKENFTAAAQQTANLVRQLTPEQRLQSIPVDEVMIDMLSDKTVKLPLTADRGPEKLKLIADIVDAILEKEQRNRLPIVDQAGKVLYVLHRSYIDKFLVRRAQDPTTPIANVTLKDLLADKDLQSVFQAFATVGRDARLIAVKQAMDGNTNCSDAFMTEDGTKGSRAIGWVTNVIVREKSIA